MDPHLIHDSYGPSEPTTQTASLSVQPVFAQTTVECPYTLQWNAYSPLPKKFAPSHGGSGSPSNIWFPGSTQVLNLNGSSIGAAVFAGLTSVTDRPTDRPTDHATRSVTIGRVEWSVGRSVCGSVCHTSEPCKNGCTDRDAVWVQDSGDPKEPSMGVQIPHGKGNFEGAKGRPIVKYRDTLRSSL